MNTLTNFILQRVFGRVVGATSGYKMYASGASFILGAAVLLLNMVISGHYDQETVEKVVASFGVGLGIIGTAHKMDKAKLGD